MKYKHMFIAFCAWMLLVSCSANINDYQGSTPKFALFEYFSGETKAWGIVQDITGLQTRRFVVDLYGEVNGNELNLKENFVFDDGEKMTRTWQIVSVGQGQYQGQANDVEGIAYGQEQGNAFYWHYPVDLLVKDREYRVTFDDWLYRLDETHMFNLAKIKKWGLTVGSVTIYFEKQKVNNAQVLNELTAPAAQATDNAVVTF